MKRKYGSLLEREADDPYSKAEKERLRIHAILEKDAVTKKSRKLSPESSALDEERNIPELDDLDLYGGQSASKTEVSAPKSILKGPKKSILKKSEPKPQKTDSPYGSFPAEPKPRTSSSTTFPNLDSRPMEKPPPLFPIGKSDKPTAPPIPGIGIYNEEIEDEEAFLYGSGDTGRKSHEPISKTPQLPVKQQPSSQYQSFDYGHGSKGATTAVSVAMSGNIDEVYPPPFQRGTNYQPDVLQSSDPAPKLSLAPEEIYPEHDEAAMDSTAEETPKEEKAYDPTIENILKSIGFNFDLSKKIQDMKKKEREKVTKSSKKKPESGQFGINQTASFLSGGLSEIDIGSAFAKSKPKPAPVNTELDIDSLIRDAKTNIIESQKEYGREHSSTRSYQKSPPRRERSRSPSRHDRSPPRSSRRSPDHHRGRSPSPRLDQRSLSPLRPTRRRSPSPLRPSRCSQHSASRSPRRSRSRSPQREHRDSHYDSPHPVSAHPVSAHPLSARPVSDYPPTLGAPVDQLPPQPVSLPTPLLNMPPPPISSYDPRFGYPPQHVFSGGPPPPVPPPVPPPAPPPDYPPHAYPPPGFPPQAQSYDYNQAPYQDPNYSYEGYGYDGSYPDHQEIPEEFPHVPGDFIPDKENMAGKSKKEKEKKTQTFSNLRVIQTEDEPTPPGVEVPPPMKSKSTIKLKKEKKFSKADIDKLAGEREERRKRLTALEKELGKLQKQQNEMMRKVSRKKDGDKDPLLLQNTQLQDEITAQVKALKKIIDDNSKTLTANGYKSPPPVSEPTVPGVNPDPPGIVKKVEKEPEKEKERGKFKFKLDKKTKVEKLKVKVRIYIDFDPLRTNMA
jgi:hypothetical protein